jgi:hypothetical protein
VPDWPPFQKLKPAIKRNGGHEGHERPLYGNRLAQNVAFADAGMSRVGALLIIMSGFAFGGRLWVNVADGRHRPASGIRPD